MPTDVGAIGEILGFNLRLAHGAVVRHFTEHFAELDLTQKQVSVLWLTHDQPGIAQTDLAQALQMDRATTMAIVHKLEARGLIARQPSPDDKRRIALRLTVAGEEAFGKARAAIESHEKWLCDQFKPGEVAALLKLLRRIHQ